MEYESFDHNQSRLAAKAIAAGADIVIGAHPHVLQKAEQTADGRIIAYSLGNFVFPMRWQVSMDSAVLFVQVDISDYIKYQKHKLQYYYVPVSLETNRPVPVSDGEEFRRTQYIMDNGYDYPQSRLWPKNTPWSKND